ncbi:MAG: carboxymuconolactone decarboxylase family protein [Gemmatimonadota bacterium]
MRSTRTSRNESVMSEDSQHATLPDAGTTTLQELDGETGLLVRLAALLAGGSESMIRDALTDANSTVRAEWIEEVILQTYLFAGFPRALNAAREWRRLSGRPAPQDEEAAEHDASRWLERGLATCATVYGPFYERLRVNIRELHPALDTWMIVEGYGKVLGRPGLDLARRELCVVAACAIARQDRQLHSHFHGALHAGASAATVSAALDTIADLIADDDMRRYRGLWARVQGK